MNKLFTVFFTVIFCLSCGNGGTSIDLASLSQRLAKASPGDTIVVREGGYKDIQLVLEGRGKEGAPIVVKAERPGRVFIEGESNLRLCGEYVEISGFCFRNGYSPKGAVIEYRNGDKAANNCRITDCAIHYFNPASRATAGNWVLIYGRHNRFDHNSIVGKMNSDVTVAVVMSQERDRENHHRIDHNYFGARPVFGSNGGETLRVGTSQNAFSSSNTLIEENMFDHCDGEVEVVSIKSSDNIIRNNTFLENAGLLVLRHGNRNLVEGNAFIGNGKANSGGIRVINAGHIIKNNLFYALRGDRFFSALALMNAVPNSLPNRYHHVKDVLIENNRFIDCDNILFCAGKDNERTLPPSNVLLKDNQFVNKSKTVVYQVFDDISGLHFENNRVKYAAAVNLPGFINDKTLSEQFNLASYTDRAKYGASWYVPETEKSLALSGKIIRVKAGQNTLLKALDNTAEGDIIQLEDEGEYWNDATLAIGKFLRIQAAPGLNKRPVLRFNGVKKAALLTLMNNAKLEIKGIAFNGEAQEGKAYTSGGISTNAEVITPYRLVVDSCEFYNYYESNLAAISGLKSTFSPEITIRNSYFHDMSGEGINYAAEKEDRGKYSVEKLIVENCMFYRLLGSALNVYRGGNDESTSGPCVMVKGCTFENVDNKEQGSVMRLLGVQQAEISHCSFIDSGRGGASIRFNEMSWDKIAVSDINLWNSGRISSFWGKVGKENITHNKPQ